VPGILILFLILILILILFLPAPDRIVRRASAPTLIHLNQGG